jgi:hypothetical protein
LAAIGAELGAGANQVSGCLFWLVPYRFPPINAVATHHRRAPVLKSAREGKFKAKIVQISLGAKITANKNRTGIFGYF